jgi:hypothetical protein
MYTLQNLATGNYARFTTGGLKIFFHYRTIRAERDKLNKEFGFPLWVVRREQK